MAKQMFAANKLKGGVAGALDDINHTTLEDGNIAIVIDASSDTTYFYKYDDSETGAETDISIIIPDSNSTGSGAWVLEDVYSNDLTVGNDLNVKRDADIDRNLNVDGAATIDGAATAASLQLGGSGATPTEFSTDGTMGGNSDTAVPTEKAVKTYVDQLPNDDYIINGQAIFWQRGTSFTSSGYTADRWELVLSGASTTLTRSDVSLTDAMSIGGGPAKSFDAVVTTASSASEYSIFRQKIESVVRLANQNITVSFWAVASSALDIAVEVSQNFGTGGSPSAQVNVTPEKKTLSTSWTKYTATFAMPSIAGKTLGSDSNNSTMIRFWFSAGSDWNTRTDSLGNQSGTFNITNVKVETGSAATPYHPRFFSEEFNLCQRYFYKTYNRGTAPGTATNVGAYANRYASALSGHWAPMRYAVSMRTTPTLTYYSLTGTSGKVSAVTTALAHSSNVTVNNTYGQGTSGNIGLQLASVQQYIAWQFTADAEL